MRYPNFNEERKLWRRGYRYVVGLDEAGRGALAAPVIAAAVVLKSKIKKEQVPRKREQKSKLQFKIQNLEINDSKKLSPKQRKYFYKILTTHPQIKWGIGRVSEKIIDKINILEATKLAMRKAVKNLEKKFQKGLSQKSSDRTNFATSSFLLIDGNFGIDSDISQKSIIKADEKVFSCAAASILAKVWRDRIMLRYHKKYPKYGFAKHKGYPTKLHKEMVRKNGLCYLHRKSFKTN